MAQILSGYHTTHVYIKNYPKDALNWYEKHIQRLIVAALGSSTGPANASPGASLGNPSPA